MDDTNSKNNSKPRVRGKPCEEKPFCWLARNALERIREFQDMKHTSVTLAIYGALSELASRNGSERFTTTQRSIMKLAGIGSDNTLRKHLGDLRNMRLLKIDKGHYPNGLKAQCTYTLLSSAERTAATAERTASRLRNKEKKVQKESTSLRNGHILRMNTPVGVHICRSAKTSSLLKKTERRRAE